MEKKKQQWLSVYQYAKKHGISKQKIYMDIRLGKMEGKYRTGEIMVKRTQILDEE